MIAKALIATTQMDNQKVYTMQFAKVYPLLVNKVVKKGRTKEEADEVIRWLTRYTKRIFAEQDCPRILKQQKRGQF